MTDRDESLLRQLYLLPECPTVETVWQRWRDRGNGTTIDAVRTALWNLPIDCLCLRYMTLNGMENQASARLHDLYTIERRLIEAWQGHNQIGIRLLTIERDLADLISRVQRKLADTAREVLA